jgi:uncharacterized protein (DUF2235 family)
MKRLVFCFDGTWHRLDSETPTNVVITAESVLPLAADGTAQLIFYDEGVGTDKNERLRGGLFGSGLVKNLADGYRFLIFNYSPGDQIYVFGFSRGAYTARSFAGLLNTCGVLLRRHAGKVGEAIALYKQRDTSEAYAEKMRLYRRDHSPECCASDEEELWRARSLGNPALKLPRLEIAYMGVWDTVGALGIPARYKLLSWMNRKHEFHDTALSDLVRSARHAVAIDERRKDFVPTLWDNIDALNAKRGKTSDCLDAPYRQVWFPGVHNAVGGGGERRGLSDQALDWVLDGARAAGLVFDAGVHSRIFELAPDYREHLQCAAKPGLATRAMNALAAADRMPGPGALHEISISARRRWLEDPQNLEDQTLYRPPTLSRLADDLDALDRAKYGLSPSDSGHFGRSDHTLYQVKRGDTLTAIAKRHYGDPRSSALIVAANRNKIDDPDRIYPGQLLRLPALAANQRVA